MNDTLHRDLHQRFYQNLGRLFYAIAAVDGVIKKEEIDALKKIVREEWLDLDEYTDSFGTDAAFQIEIIFDWLDANKPDPQNAFQTFMDFHADHKELFTPQINEKILAASQNIAAAFRGKNKSELVMLAKLQSLLKK
ncbi:TerB family tellurite resistance protein [Salinimicrobium catena]|nr:TerB family tellurite resistance protein [Salinimicrobium catena]